MALPLLPWIKFILASAALSGYYHWFLLNRPLHLFNRFYLLAAIPISLLVPYLPIGHYQISVAAAAPFFTRVQVPGRTWIISVVGLVSAGFLLRLVIGVVRILRLKARHHCRPYGNFILVETALPEAPFSFFNLLFWRDDLALEQEPGRQVLAHEMVHMRQWHSLDQLYMQLLSGLLWFNPFCHYLSRELTLVHEFLADARSVPPGDTESFARMLLHTFKGGGFMEPAQHFHRSPLRRRLQMIEGGTLSVSGTARKFAGLLVMAVTGFLLSISVGATRPQNEKGFDRMQAEKQAAEQAALRHGGL